LFPIIDHQAGRFRTVAVPVHIDGADVGPRGAAPDIGQHTEEVLEAAGLTPGEVAALAAAGVIGPRTLDEPDHASPVDLAGAQLTWTIGDDQRPPKRTPRAAASPRTTPTKPSPERTKR
jgi:hypothetical protein